MLSLAALAPTAQAQPAPSAPPTEPATPGPASPSDTQPTAAAATTPEAKPAEAKPAAPLVTSKWDGTLYGFVELDAIYDSTEGLNETPGNPSIARSGTYPGDHGQTTFSARNSRLGYRISAPTYNGIKATGQIEADFLGNQPPGTAEASVFQNAALRIRHANLKLETPVVDILVGQFWQLFGWQTAYHPNTAEIQGLPGEVFSRAPQIRVSKKVKAGDVSVDLAIAAVRPPQRASATPDGQAGIKLNYDAIKGYRTAGASGSSLDSASVAVSVIGRRFSVNEFSATPVDSVERNGYGISVDALIPVVPATKDHKGNALTLTGSFVTGAGIADQYTGLSGGVGNPALPNPTGANPAPTYTPNVDGGLVQFSADGTLHPVQWTSYIVGAQYYLPPSAKVWIAGNYSHIESDNAHAFGPATRVFEKLDWADGNLFFDITPAVRLGLEFAWFNQTYADGADTTNYRGQLTGLLLF